MPNRPLIPPNTRLRESRTGSRQTFSMRRRRCRRRGRYPRCAVDVADPAVLEWNATGLTTLIAVDVVVVIAAAGVVEVPV